MIYLPNETKVLVIGDIHEHKRQFFELVENFKPQKDRLLISVGDIYDKGEGKEIGDEIVRELQQLQKLNLAYVIRGNHELKIIKEAQKEKRLNNELIWFAAQPLSYRFKIENFELTIIHGGIEPTMKIWSNVEENPDICYVCRIDTKTGKRIKWKWIEENGKKKIIEDKKSGVLWHELYDGRFGYIVSGHDAQEDGIAKFYTYSCNLDSCCYKTGILTGAIFGKAGLEDIVTSKHEAYFKGFTFAQD